MASNLNLLAQGSVSERALSGFDDPTTDSPDNWLAGAAAQGHVSQLAGQAPTTRNEPNTIEAPPAAGTSGGQLSSALDNAMGWVGTQYDWGGNGYAGRGVDCSGLVYNAFKRAGFNVQRYRAVDYGHMGVSVSAESARPGDIVYFDNPGDVDHVGIYLGNGKFIESPQPGERVKVSPLRSGAQIRRIFAGATPDLQPGPMGHSTYFAPDGTEYAGTHVSDQGAQRDPFDQLNALDASVQTTLDQHFQQVNQQLGDTAADKPRGSAANQMAADTGNDTSHLGRIMNALAGQESGGDYSVVNSIGARGKYQVMTANVGTWSQQVLGYRVSPAEFSARPDLQEAIVRGIFGGYVNKYGLRGALAAWYSGRPNRENDYSHVGNGPSVGEYVDQVIARIR